MICILSHTSKFKTVPCLIAAKSCVSEVKLCFKNSQIPYLKVNSIFKKFFVGNEILTSIKGHNSVANLQKMTLYNLNLNLVNASVYTNFGYILSIGSQDIERKRNSDINQGP